MNSTTIQLSARFSTAFALALTAHEGQIRKGGVIPYISHPMAVAAIALEFGATEHQAIAALLHDVIEDGGAQYLDIIKNQFGDEVLALVLACTDAIPDGNGDKPDWKSRKLAYLEHLRQVSDAALLVSGADKLHNARSIVKDLVLEGNRVFERFTGDRNDILWYYRELSRIFSERQAPMAGFIAYEVERMISLI